MGVIKGPLGLPIPGFDPVINLPEINSIQDGPVIREFDPIVDRPPEPNGPSFQDNPGQDLPTQEEMNPDVEPVPPIEAVPMETIGAADSNSEERGNDNGDRSEDSDGKDEDG